MCDFLGFKAQVYLDFDRELPPVTKPGQKYIFKVKMAELLACVFYYGFSFIGVVFIIFGCVRPGAVFLPSSLHADPRDFTNPYRILSFLALNFVVVNFFSVAVFVMISLMILDFPVLLVIDNLR